MAPTISPSVPIASDDRFASAIVAGSTSGFHVLRIEGYSGTKFTIPNGQHVESHPFRIAGHTWTIRYYPNGNSPETADYISLFLVLKETVAKHLMVQLVLSFIDQVDKQRPSYVRGLMADRFVSHGSWGRKNFVKRTELEQSERLRDDCFTVRCDIIVLSEPRAEAGNSFVKIPPPDWSEHFRELLRGGKGADVRFLVGGETFAAHRCVLAARSPVFGAMLLGPMKEDTTTQNQIQSCIPVTIDGMVPQVFRSLLHFIYTDSLPAETEDQGNNTEDGTSATMLLQHLLEAADRYGMQRLKLICEDRLCRHMDVSTVATTLALADQHGCRGLKEACCEFLKSSKTLDAVMATDGFQHLVKSCPSVLFELMSKLASH